MRWPSMERLLSEGVRPESGVISQLVSQQDLKFLNLEDSDDSLNHFQGRKTDLLALVGVLLTAMSTLVALIIS